MSFASEYSGMADASMGPYKAMLGAMQHVEQSKAQKQALAQKQKDLDFRIEQEGRLMQEFALRQEQYKADMIQKNISNRLRIAEQLPGGMKKQYLQQQFGDSMGLNLIDASQSSVSDLAKDMNNLLTNSEIPMGKKRFEYMKILSKFKAQNGDLSPDDERQIQNLNESFFRAVYPTRVNIETDTVANKFYKKNFGELNESEAEFVNTYMRRKEWLNKVSEPTAVKLIGMETRINELNALKKTLDSGEYDDKFGFFTEKWNDIARTFSPDAEEEEINRRVRSLLEVLYEVSGKQLSDSEIAIAKKAWLPSMGQPVENASAAIGVLHERMENKYKNLTNNLYRYGYVTPEQAEQALMGESLSGKTEDKSTQKTATMRFNPKTGKLEKVED